MLLAGKTPCPTLGNWNISTQVTNRSPIAVDKSVSVIPSGCGLRAWALPCE